MPTPPTDITRLLSRVQNGDASAADRLMPLVYEELRRLADGYLRREAPGHTLQATALVHEAYLRMVDQRDAQWRSRAHFLAMSAQMIRRILVDHARARRAAKRGGKEEPITLQESIGLVASAEPPVDLLDLHDALEELARRNERQARVVELRYFGGLTVEAAAHVLGVSSRTVKDDWRFARAWLRARLLSGEQP
jgi:RNA polymerase sigma-70 factor (ECF subfamily)